MHYMKLLSLHYRTITLSLIAATSIMLAVLVLSPTLAYGSSIGNVEREAMSPRDSHGKLDLSWDALPAAPHSSFQQITPDSPATMRECKEQMAAGHAVRCSANSFSVTTVRPNGEYQINWSAWAGRHDNVDRYTIQRLRFMYRYNFEREDNGDAVDSWDYTVPDVNSCVPRAAETDSRGRATRWAWNCQGISQVREDPFGGPTSIEDMEDFDDNWTSDSWTDSLQAPGHKRDIPVQALRIPGNWDEAHVDNPQNSADRLTQQQVEDGTVDLLFTEFEMHLYLITVHFDDGATQTRYELVNGTSFEDR